MTEKKRTLEEERKYWIRRWAGDCMAQEEGRETNLSGVWRAITNASFLWSEMEAFFKGKKNPRGY